VTRDLPFKVVRSHTDHDELLATAANLIIARAAYSAAVLMYPEDRIEVRQGAGVVYYSKT